MRCDCLWVRLDMARTEPHFIGIKPERRTKLRKGRRERDAGITHWRYPQWRFHQRRIWCQCYALEWRPPGATWRLAVLQVTRVDGSVREKMFRSPRNVALAPPASHRGHTKRQAIARMTPQVFAALVTIFVLASPGRMTAAERAVSKSQSSLPQSVDELTPNPVEDCTELIFDDVVRSPLAVDRCVKSCTRSDGHTTIPISRPMAGCQGVDGGSAYMYQSLTRTLSGTSGQCFETLRDRQALLGAELLSKTGGA
jgi:hypothetical protein